jgi:hypothetical protein
MRFEVGEKNYELVYSINVIADMEETTGRSFDSIFTGPSISALRLLIWTGLITNNTNMTLRQAGDIVQEYLAGGNSVESLTGVVTKAMSDAGFLAAQGAKRVKK